jgi:predicted ATPase
MSAGCQYFWEAAYAKAARYTDHIRATYDEVGHAPIVAYANHDPLCFSLHWAGSLLDWIIGYPDRSLERLEDALAIARRLGHPFNLAFALTAGSHSLITRGDSERMLAQCDEAQAVIVEGGLGVLAENSMVRQWRGQAHILRREFSTGYDIMRQGNDFWNATEGRICNAMWWCLMSVALNGMGRGREALELIDRAIAHCRQTGDRYMEPECLRIRGELLLAAEDPDHAGADMAFRQSIQTAQAHEAKSWELRGSTSLARLLRTHGEDHQARDVLDPVYGWFTEGLETPDLVQARSLLEDLS